MSCLLLVADGDVLAGFNLCYSHEAQHMKHPNEHFSHRLLFLLVSSFVVSCQLWDVSQLRLASENDPIP